MNKSCTQCAQQFTVTSEDLAFYDKVSPVIAGKKYQIPAPTLCPECRQQRRLAFRNERKLYHRKCDLCRKEIISTFSPDKSQIVYCPKCFWSDKWNALDYGLSYDFNKDFFTQYRQLQKKVPQISLNVAQNDNSEYTNYAGNNKNCYLLFSGEYNEDVFFADHTIKCKKCFDTDQTFNSELIYDSVNIEKSYNLKYAINCKNSFDSMFIYDCVGCNDCIFCTNLRNKKFHIYNKSYSEEEFQKEKQKILDKIKTWNGLQDARQTFKEMVAGAIHRHGKIINSENSNGDYIFNSKNCQHSFNVTSCRDCKFVSDGFDCTDLYDVDATTEAELSYNCMSVGYKAYNVMFSHHVWWSSNVLYSVLAKSCDNIFGCASIANKSFCILNKLYNKDEYSRLLEKIIRQMQESGQWGSFFPIDMTFYGYNETIANDLYPLSKEHAVELGYKWKEKDKKNQYIGKKLNIPDFADEDSRNIISQILTCDKCSENYRIIEQEFNFYSRFGLTLPRFCSNCRRKERTEYLNSHKFWTRPCANCSAPMQTTYAPDRPETVYCEECYLAAVY
jgi:hypothetical protein